MKKVQGKVSFSICKYQWPISIESWELADIKADLSVQIKIFEAYNWLSNEIQSLFSLL